MDRLLRRPGVTGRIRPAAAIAAAAVVALGAACTGQDIVIQSSGAATRVVIRLAAGPARPTAELSFGEARQPGGVGSTCWRGDAGATACVDVAGVPIPPTPVDVPRAATLAVMGDMSSATVSIGELTEAGSTRGMGPATEVALSGGEGVLDVPAGVYVLEVDGSWPQGDAPFSFLIRVV
jgi:hypothetical protein